MNIKEKFLKIAMFELTGEIFIASWFQWFWYETILRWVSEGAPKTLLSIEHYPEIFGFEHTEIVPVNNDLICTGKYANPPYILPLFPLNEIQVIKDEGETEIIIDEQGVTLRRFKNDLFKMPQWLEYPVKNRKTWEIYKKKLDPHEPARYPAYWDDYVKKVKERDYPLGFPAGSLFGFLRGWMGLEPLLFAFHDDPMFVLEMMDYMYYFFMEFYKKILADIEVDWVYFWEDMAFKSGPLISPKFMREFMVPRYKKMTEYLRNHGVDIIIIDNDGNLDEMIPIWLESGINGSFPLEVASDVDAVEIRKKYGKNFICFGNIDKRVLAKSKDAIDRELDNKIPFLISEGGYFPMVDHFVPPDVSWENWQYFLKKLRSYSS